MSSIVKNERYTSEELIQFCVGVLSKFKKEIRRLHKYLSAIGNGIALLKQVQLEMKIDNFKQLEKIDNLSSMIFPLLLVEVCENNWNVIQYIFMQFLAGNIEPRGTKNESSSNWAWFRRNKPRQLFKKFSDQNKFDHFLSQL